MPISQREAGTTRAATTSRSCGSCVPVDSRHARSTASARCTTWSRTVRAERSLDHTETIAGFLNLMPKGVIGAMLKGVDFLASNVPGVPMPMWLEGRKVERFFPFGPTAGSAVNVTLMSYDGMCCIGRQRRRSRRARPRRARSTACATVSPRSAPSPPA